MNVIVQWPVIEPYGKPTFEIYICGCTRMCPNCHNPELIDYNAGDPLEVNNLISGMKARKKLFDCISVTGGDLLCQDLNKAMFLSGELKLKFPDKELWLFTGENDFYKIPKFCKETYDYIKFGSYKEELKQDGFPSSSNQKLIRKGIDY